ncbi:hypothetical protein LIER_43171 [Lithospermum erythrorhizon]|uniref:Uncharacterized protein n=1 Tax=Lithospermum erythrorhizon TaxID=34254 RepID=A0AAV3PMP6_LITER
MQEVPKSQTAAESGKAANPSSAYCSRNSPESVSEDNVDKDRPIEVDISDDDTNVSPLVKPVHPPSEETSHKPDSIQSSQEPTLAKFLSRRKGGRIKRVLRKQGAPVRFVRKSPPQPTNTEEDDDIIIVSSTAGKRRTRATTAAYEKNKEKLGSGGESSNTEKIVDSDKLEKMVAKKEMSRKGKRSTEGRSEKGNSKKRKGIEIPKKGDDFVIDDEESSGEERKGPGSSKDRKHAAKAPV